MEDLVDEPATHIRLTGVSKRYVLDDGRELRAADAIDLEVARGEVVALTGPSGSGKSTLLHLIGGIDAADAGSIAVDGQEITALGANALAAYRRSLGFVFQRFHLLDALTARDNVISPLVPFRTPFSKVERADALLAAVGLEGREGALPSRLSGGQQQRVAIARALVWEPALLLADEPTGNLDSTTGREVLDLLLGLRDDRGATIVLATHDPSVAGRCDRTIQVRDGRLEAAPLA
jgi:putative ABC transport system ATP-binding protein